MRRYGLYDASRGLTLALAAALAGLGLWGATQVGMQTNGRFWISMAIVAGAGLLIALGYAMNEAGRVAHLQNATGRVSIAASSPAALVEELANWPADPHAFNQAVKAAITLFEAVRPEGEFEPAVEHHSIRATNLPGEPLVLEDFDIPPLAWGHSVASGVLQAVAEPETVGPILKELASSIRERLGSESVALIERRVAPATGERK